MAVRASGRRPRRGARAAGGACCVGRSLVSSLPGGRDRGRLAAAGELRTSGRCAWSRSSATRARARARATASPLGSRRSSSPLALAALARVRRLAAASAPPRPHDRLALRRRLSRLLRRADAVRPAGARRDARRRARRDLRLRARARARRRARGDPSRRRSSCSSARAGRRRSQERAARSRSASRSCSARSCCSRALTTRRVPRAVVPAAAALALVALVASTSSAVAKGELVSWQRWDFYNAPQPPVSVSFVWDAQYGGIRFPRKRTTVLEIKAPQRSLYWRAAVLDAFAGDRWVEAPPRAATCSSRAAAATALLRQDVHVLALADTHLVGASVPVRFDAGDAPLVRRARARAAAVRPDARLPLHGAGATRRSRRRPSRALAPRAIRARSSRRASSSTSGRGVTAPPFGAAARPPRRRLLDAHPEVAALRAAPQAAVDVAGGARTPYAAAGRSSVVPRRRRLRVHEPSGRRRARRRSSASSRRRARATASTSPGRWR